MDAKGMMNSDLETLEEKLQILKSKIGQEEYETIRKEIDEIRKLGVDLPDSGYMANVNSIIKRMVDLEFDSFNSKALKEAIKEVKREGFLAKLDYIKVCIKEGKDVSQVFSSAKLYWDVIKGSFDAFEVSEVERKLDEINLEMLLRKVQTSKEVNLSEAEKISYLLVRERLQNLLDNKTISQAIKLLIKSWLGESIDTETGKVSAEFIEDLLKNSELWEVLSGVKGVEVKNNQERQKPQRNTETQIPQQTQSLISLGESQRRVQEITKLSEMYNIPLGKFDFTKKKYAYALYVMRYKRFGEIKYKLIGEDKAVKLKRGNKLARGEVVAVVFNNHLTNIKWDRPTSSEIVGHTDQPTLEYAVLPDYLQTIYGAILRGTGLRKLIIPGTVKMINSGAFSSLCNLQDVLLEEGIVNIQQYAFEDTGIKEINIPSSVKNIGQGAFCRCSQLEKVTFEYGIRIIGPAAFAVTGLKEVEIPGSVEKLEGNVFQFSPLQKVVLNEGLSKIEAGALGNCHIKEIDIPETVKRIEPSAFEGNPLKSVTISENADFKKSAFPPEAIIRRRVKEEENSVVERLERENAKLREENKELKKKIAKFEKVIKGTERKSETMDK